MAEEHRRRAPFKLVLALLLIVGIAGLIAYSNFGGGFQNFKLGGFASAPKTPSEPFTIVLSTGTPTLYGKTFQIDKLPFSAKGVCGSIAISNLKVDRSESRCSVSGSSFSGTFQYTTFGSIVFSGSTDTLTIDTNKYSSASPVTFSIELIPTEFSVTGITASSISVVAPSGKIEKYGKDGSLLGVGYLNNSTLDISNLFGRVDLASGELKITGTATSVKSHEFSW